VAPILIYTPEKQRDTTRRASSLLQKVGIMSPVHPRCAMCMGVDPCTLHILSN